MTSQQYVLITGANRGIGLALTQLYCEKGYQVVACCRKSSTELILTSAQIVEGLDVTDVSTYNLLENVLAEYKFDIIIHNAGLLQNEVISNLNSFSHQSIVKQMEVNAFGPLYLTGFLFSYLAKGSKLVFITSRMGSIEDNTSGGRYGYRMSKAALNMAVKSLSIDLKEKDVSVGLIHPGWVKTRMTGFTGNSEPNYVSEQIFSRIGELNINNSGHFYHAKGDILPW
mgnify:CR=1 FL=1